MDIALDSVRTNARAYLDAVAAPLSAETLRVRTVLVDDFLVPAILDLARSPAVDLIVLATHRRSGATR